MHNEERVAGWTRVGGGYYSTPIYTRKGDNTVLQYYSTTVAACGWDAYCIIEL
jgi:hypothetical protein